MSAVPFNMSCSRFSTSYTSLEKRGRDIRSQSNSPYSGSRDSSSTPIPKNIVRQQQGNPSVNTLSMVSKFEALDAQTQPRHDSVPQPAPLKVSRNSSSRKHSVGIYQIRKHSTIYRPTKNRSSQAKYDKLSDDYAPEREGKSGKIEDDTKRSLARTSWRSRPRRIMSPRKSRSSLRGETETDMIRSNSHQKNRASSTLPKKIEVENRGMKRLNSIKDMIRFYDGATPTRRTAKAKPSRTHLPVPRTPVSKICTDNLNTYRSRGKRSLVKLPDGYTTDAPSPSPCTRKKGNISGSQVPFYIHTPNSKISLQIEPLPMLNPGSPVRCTVETKSNKSPQRGSLHPDIFKPPVSASSQRSTATNLSTRGKTLGSIYGNKRLVSPRCARIESQIEALYRAKSMETQAEKSQDDTEGQVERTQIPLRVEAHDRGHLKDDKITHHGTEAGTSPSKVSQMKRKIEMQINPKPKPLQSLLRPITMDVKMAQVTQPIPVPPPMPTLSTRASSISPGTILGNFTLGTQMKTTLSKSPRNAELIQKVKPSRTSANLGDRIQLFEDIDQWKAKLDSRRKKRSISAKHGNPISSRRNIFERTFRKSAGKRGSEDRQCLSMKDVQDTVDEVEKVKTDRKPTKRKSFGGSWSLFPQAAVSERTSIAELRTSKDNTINLLQRTSESLKMVIKEAECGLREPKPMKLVEMKRMMLLCREKAGFLSEKEKLSRAGGFAKL